MKTATILFAHKDSDYMFEKVFGGASAFEKALEWAYGNESSDVFLFCFDEKKALLEEKLASSGKKARIVSLSGWKTANIIEESVKILGETGSEALYYAWADCPFLNRALTKEIFETHTQFLAEYTYAEGYPYGFAPEIIDGGTLGILKQLSEDSFKANGEKEVTRTSLFDFLKTDINAFEVETVLAEEDYRLFRYSFDCGKKENFLQCKALFENLSDKGDLSSLDPEELSEAATKNLSILKTVPGFYNIQISPKSGSKPIYVPENSPLNKGENMDTEKLFGLIDQIAELSEKAVVGLSYFGDPVNHPDLEKICEKILSKPGLSVFIETDYMDPSTAGALKKVSDAASERTNGYEKIMVAVNMDAATGSTFAKVRGLPESDFEKTVASVGLLSELFPESAYPQFIRMNENENELESFYRYWNEKSNPSKGNLIITKYNSYCKSLPERKPADLSPVERNVCWHLRRDVNILSNGDVTFCHCVYGKVMGNVFENKLEEIWNGNQEEIENQIAGKYCSECGDCDEYYTFNF